MPPSFQVFSEFESIEALRECLEKYNITSFMREPIFIQKLFHELSNQTSELQLWSNSNPDSSPKKYTANKKDNLLLRVVHVLRCLVYDPEKPNAYLIERQTGSESKGRKDNRLLTVKFHPMKENLLQLCCNRAAQELSQCMGYTITVDNVSLLHNGVPIKKTEMSKSFPGLLTQYFIFSAAIAIRGLPPNIPKVFETTEEEEGGTIYHLWEWVSKSELQRLFGLSDADFEFEKPEQPEINSEAGEEKLASVAEKTNASSPSELDISAGSIHFETRALSLNSGNRSTTQPLSEGDCTEQSNQTPTNNARVSSKVSFNVKRGGSGKSTAEDPGQQTNGTEDSSVAPLSLTALRDKSAIASAPSTVGVSSPGPTRNHKINQLTLYEEMGGSSASSVSTVTVVGGINVTTYRGNAIDDSSIMPQPFANLGRSATGPATNHDPVHALTAEALRALRLWNQQANILAAGGNVIGGSMYSAGTAVNPNSTITNSSYFPSSPGLCLLVIPCMAKLLERPELLQFFGKALEEHPGLRILITSTSVSRLRQLDVASTYTTYKIVNIEVGPLHPIDAAMLFAWNCHRPLFKEDLVSPLTPESPVVGMDGARKQIDLKGAKEKNDSSKGAVMPAGSSGVSVRSGPRKPLSLDPKTSQGRHNLSKLSVIVNEVTEGNPANIQRVAQRVTRELPRLADLISMDRFYDTRF